MLRGYALQIRPEFSAGYNEAPHSGCAGTLNSRRSRFPFGRIGIQITLRKALHSLIVLNIQLAENLRSANSIFGLEVPSLVRCPAQIRWAPLSRERKEAYLARRSETAFAKR